MKICAEYNSQPVVASWMPLADPGSAEGFFVAVLSFSGLYFNYSWFHSVFCLYCFGSVPVIVSLVKESLFISIYSSPLASVFFLCHAGVS